MRKYYSREILRILWLFKGVTFFRILSQLQEMYGKIDSLCFMYLIDRFSQLLRYEVVLHFINTWDFKYPLSRNFYVRTCVKFAFANKIKEMDERPHVQLCKRKSRNSLNLTFNLNTLCFTSIWFTWLKFTCVNVSSQKRIRENPP